MFTNCSLIFGLLLIRSLAMIWMFSALRGVLGAGGLWVVAASLCSGAVPLVSWDISGEYISQHLLFFGVREAILGCVLGSVPALLSEIPAIAGRIIDTLRGAQYIEQVSALAEARVSVLENLGELLVPFLLFSTVAYQDVLIIFYMSLLDPLAGSFSAGSLGVLPLTVQICFWALKSAAAAFFAGMLIASPLIVIMLAIEIGMLSLGKVLGSLSIQSEGAVIKLFIGLIFFLIVADKIGREFLLALRGGSDFLVTIFSREA